MPHKIFTGIKHVIVDVYFQNVCEDISSIFIRFVKNQTGQQ